MDPTDLGTLHQFGQLGIAGMIIFAVIHLQRSTFSNLQQLIGILMPALDVRVHLARVEGKIDSLTAVVTARQPAAPERPDRDSMEPVIIEDDGGDGEDEGEEAAA